MRLFAEIITALAIAIFSYLLGRSHERWVAAGVIHFYRTMVKEKLGYWPKEHPTAEYMEQHARRYVWSRVLMATRKKAEREE